MTLGFYYHTPVIRKNEYLFVTSQIGLFLDSIAPLCRQLVLIMHEATINEEASCNYAIQASNIHWVNLGTKTPAWHRVLFGKKQLREAQKLTPSLDALLVRAPTPLGPFFYSVYAPKNPVSYLLVGDYVASAPHLHLPFIRKWAIYAMSVYLDLLIKKAARQCCMFSNSHEILKKISPFAKESHYVRTTTLTEADFYVRADTCQSPTINVLYVGRFDFAKGLRELVEACAMLIQKGIQLNLHLAGWEEGATQPVTAWLEENTARLGISNNIVNHGRLNHGAQLNNLYRSTDIFVIPSYQEGFPRVIWEAMANGVPVIATTVGSIPYNLTNEVDAMLIPPMDASIIAEKIALLANSPTLRQHLISNGLVAAKSSTLEVQSRRLIEILQQFVAKGNTNVKTN